MLLPHNLLHFKAVKKDKCYCCEMEIELKTWCIDCDPGGKVVPLCGDCDEDIHDTAKGRKHKRSPYQDDKPAPRDLQDFADSLLEEIENDLDAFNKMNAHLNHAVMEVDNDDNGDAAAAKKKKKEGRPEKTTTKASIKGGEDKESSSANSDLIGKLFLDAGIGFPDNATRSSSSSSPHNNDLKEGKKGYNTPTTTTGSGGLKRLSTRSSHLQKSMHNLLLAEGLGDMLDSPVSSSTSTQLKAAKFLMPNNEQEDQNKRLLEKLTQGKSKVSTNLVMQHLEHSNQSISHLKQQQQDAEKDFESLMEKKRRKKASAAIAAKAKMKAREHIEEKKKREEAQEKEDGCSSNDDDDDDDFLGGDVYQMEADCPKIGDCLAFGTGKIAMIACGGSHCGAITSSGLLYMWGRNNFGQLGIGSNEDNIDHPTLVVLPPPRNKKRGFSYASKLACGYRHTAAACSNSSIYTWGNGMYGVLGHGSDIDYDSPKEIQDIPQSNGVIALCCSQYNTGAVIQIDDEDDICCLLLFPLIVLYKVYTWGANESGQIGDGSLGPAMVPKRIKSKYFDGGSYVISLSFGNRHAAACCQSGKVYTWGKNEFGQLGYLINEETADSKDSKERQLVPRQVSSLSSKHNQHIIEVACGERHTSVLSNEGVIWSWGAGETHQLGILDNEDVYYPVRVDALFKGEEIVRHISVGVSVSCCVTMKGEIYVWGFAVEAALPKLINKLQNEYFRYAMVNADGKLLLLSGSTQDVYTWSIPDDEDDENDERPGCAASDKKTALERIDDLRGKRIVSIDADTHVLVACNTGELFGWGENRDGQIGVGNDDYCDFPIRVDIKESVVSVAAEEYHSLALTAGGNVYAWGNGEQGRLGLGHDRDQATPAMVKDLQSVMIRKIAAGKFNSGAIDTKGGLYLWGAGNSKQLGFKGKSERFLDTHMNPLKVKTLKDKQIKNLALGAKHAIVCTQKGEVLSWGSNDFGQLGTGEEEDYQDDDDYFLCTGPQMVKLPGGGRCHCVYAGTDLSYALTEEGKLFGWGSGETHQLANEEEDFADEWYPKEIKIQSSAGGETKITLLSLAGTNTVAIDDKGKAFGWGWDLGHDPKEIQSSLQIKEKVSNAAVAVSDIVFVF
eukprot:jgi/Bigna1/90158/estExt_fgenesh1_pg.C_630111